MTLIGRLIEIVQNRNFLTFCHEGNCTLRTWCALFLILPKNKINTQNNHQNHDTTDDIIQFFFERLSLVDIIQTHVTIIANKSEPDSRVANTP